MWEDKVESEMDYDFIECLFPLGMDGSVGRNGNGRGMDMSVVYE